MITGDQIKEIIGSSVHYTDQQYTGFAVTFNSIFAGFEINTYLRVCHFMAQVFHETEELRYSSEIWGPTAQQSAYEGRKDLGNTVAGDGYRFKGRGWFQYTGRFNYQQLSDKLKQDFINHPELLAQQPWCGLSAGYFWSLHNLNAFADKDDAESITRRINGGLNGLAEREAWLVKCKNVIKT